MSKYAVREKPSKVDSAARSDGSTDAPAPDPAVSSPASTAAAAAAAKDSIYEPTPEEIVDYAVHIGIDPVAEHDLLWIAREGLMAPLEPGWQAARDPDTLAFYFFRTEKPEETTWDHPSDERYRDLVQSVRAGIQAAAAAASAARAPGEAALRALQGCRPERIRTGSESTDHARLADDAHHLLATIDAAKMSRATSRHRLDSTSLAAQSDPELRRPCVAAKPGQTTEAMLRVMRAYLSRLFGFPGAGSGATDSLAMAEIAAMAPVTHPWKQLSDDSPEHLPIFYSSQGGAGAARELVSRHHPSDALLAWLQNAADRSTESLDLSLLRPALTECTPVVDRHNVPSIDSLRVLEKTLDRTLAVVSEMLLQLLSREAELKQQVFELKSVVSGLHESMARLLSR